MIKTMAGNRECQIELLRTLLMYGICLHHATQYQLGAFHPLTLGLLFCVDSFVFISGYYGTRLSIKKVLMLEATGVYCAVLGSRFSFPLVLETFKSYWFLHSYVFMLMLLPVVNFVFDHEHDVRRMFKIVVPFLFLIFVWGLCIELPVIHRHTPNPGGLGSFTGLTLTGVYISARLFVKADLERNLGVSALCGIFVVSLLVSCAGYGWFGHYCSPFAVLAAGSSFCLARRLSFLDSPVLRRILAIVTPSLFSVYLLHCAPCGLKFIRGFSQKMASDGLSEMLSCMIASIVVFAVAMCLDIPRRLLIWLVGRVPHK